jgi:DNA transposition AAA+ family ATPase
MKKSFVRTENLERLEAGVNMLQERGAREAGWMLVTGRPGEGKTTTLHHWGASIGAAFITMRHGWRPTQMVAALAAELKVFVGRNVDADIGEALCGDDHIGRVIVIDEAQFALQNSGACLDRLRGITDKSGTPVVLVGMAADVPKFGQREQIGSRIFNWTKFAPSGEADVMSACAQLAEVKIASDLVSRIQRDSGGRMRDVVNAIARIEMFAREVGQDSVSAADVKKVVLCEDYRNGFDLPAPRATRRATRAAA